MKHPPRCAPPASPPPPTTWRARRSGSGPTSPRCVRRRAPPSLERQRQLDARLLHAPGRLAPMFNMAIGEVDLRRRRERAVRDDLLRRDRRLHRRLDGRSNPRVPRQEDRCAPGQACRSRRARAVPPCVRLLRRSPWCSQRGSTHGSMPDRTGSGRSSTPCLSMANNNGSAFAGAHRDEPLLHRGRWHRDAHRALRSHARWRSRSQEASEARASFPQPRAPCARTHRCSSCLLTVVIVIIGAPHLPPRSRARADRRAPEPGSLF